MNRSGWYYCAEFGIFHGFRELHLAKGEYSPDAWAGNIYGPFPTFGAAKRDAQEYFRTDIETARQALAEVSKVTRKGSSEEWKHIRIDLTVADLELGVDPEAFPRFEDLRFMSLQAVYECTELVYTAPSGTVFVLKDRYGRLKAQAVEDGFRPDPKAAK